MEIKFIIPDSVLDELVNASVQKCLSRTLPPTQSEPSDHVSLDEACRITDLKKPTIYKMSSMGEIPCFRLGEKKLIFSRRELEQWMASRTIRKRTKTEIAATNLQVAAKKKSHQKR